MMAFPFFGRRRSSIEDIPVGTFATPQDVADAISQLIGGAPPVTLDTIAEIAAMIINDQQAIAAISAAIASKQDANAKLSALSALALAADRMIYATGENTLATTSLTAFMRTVLAAADAAAARNAIGAIGNNEAGVFGKNVLSMNTPAAGAVPMSSDGTGALETVVTGRAGRNLMGLDQVSTASLPLVSTTGVSFINPGNWVRIFLEQSGLSWARWYLGKAQVTFYRSTASAPVSVPANSPTEITFTSEFTETGYQSPQIAVSGGRIIGANNSYRNISDISAMIVVDGPADIEAEWRVCDANGVPYPFAGAESAYYQAPSFVNVRCTKAGRFIFTAPKGIQLNYGTGRAQLRLYLTTPAGAATVNILSASVRIETGATS